MTLQKPCATNTSSHKSRPRITISINAPGEPADQELLTLDLPPGLAVQDLKAFVQAETQFPAQFQQFYLNGQPLVGDTQTLEQAGIQDGEMLAMLIRRPQAPSAARGGRNNAAQQLRERMNNNQAGRIETTRQRILNDPNALHQLQSGQPELAAAIQDPARWREEWSNVERQQEERQREHERQAQLLNENPFDVEAQAKIEELIRQTNVMDNIQSALETNPELFASVTMLYIPCVINGYPLKAFVDSGAQVTIMSPQCAEACGIKRLIDTRYQGVAVGVGTAKILGRVHSAEITIGGAAMPCAFTVMEGKNVDLLFGLDMLKRYKAKIDLEKNALCFENIEVPFLPESEIPKMDHDARADEPTVPGPNGTEISTKSGAVRQTGGDGTEVAAGPSGVGSSNFQGQGHGVGGSSAPAPPPRQDPGFKAADIDQLVSLGFTRDQAIEALRATGGNVEYAASFLFQG